MNGIEKIVGRIQADSQREIEALNADADRRVESIRQEYEAQARKLTAETQEKAARMAADQRQRLENAADMERGKAILACKQECIDEAFRQAEQRLTSLPAEEYAGVLAAIAARAGQGDEEIVLSVGDAEKVGALVVEKANALKEGAAFTLSSEHRELEGGLLLKKGLVEINCSFATQLRLLRQDMAADVAAILFS